MTFRSYPFLALSLALGNAADPSAANPFDTVLTGNYSHSLNVHTDATVLNWNIDRGKHFDRILAAIHAQWYEGNLCARAAVTRGWFAARLETFDAAAV